MTEDANTGQTDAAKWLERIEHARKYFRFYQEKSDKVDREYANLERLANGRRDREMQLFWANLQTMNPAIYARPPVPVVVPRFQDRRPVRRAASELLERVCSTTFDLTDINSVMLAVRDSMSRNSRGVAWLRYDDKTGSKKRKGKPVSAASECVVIEFLNRRDFLHDPARQWCDVDWVARTAWLSRAEMRKRFGGDKAHRATYRPMEQNRHDISVGPTSGEIDEKAAVFEVWCKSENRVMWLTEGFPEFLDDGEPHLSIDGFFPTPRPAYATLQPDTLIPVPEFFIVADQLEEVNELTDRIHKLADAVVVRGFYPGGAGELAEAIEAAFNETGNTRVMIPVSSFAAFGGTSPKDAIVWLPIDMIVATIAQLVDLRKQLIDDVYQITGLSDIMRGSTAATETATAQQLKSQYGSIRIRDKQNELVRYARDLVRIAAEIIAEEFREKTLLDMSQMELPTAAQIEQQIRSLQMQAAQIQQQAQQAMMAAQQDPQLMAQAQANPEQAQQMLQQMQQQVQEQMQGLEAQAAQLAETVTIDQVMALLRDERLRPFVLDIESDSTIQPDEDAAKQRATEFVTAVGGFLQQAIGAVQMVPASAPLMSETLKYVAGQFRVGREMQTAIDTFADQVAQMAQQPDPAAQAAEQQMQIEQQKIEAENARTQADMQAKQQDQQAKLQETMLKLQGEQQRLQLEMQAMQQAEAIKLATAEAKLREAEVKLAIEQEKAGQSMIKGAQEIERAQIEQATRLQDAEIKRQQAEQGADIAERQARAKEGGK